MFASFLLSDSLVLAEEPARRKRRGTPEQRGWVDFWVLHRGVVHLIELKFRRYSLKSRSMDSLQKLWDEGYQQIKDVRVPAGYYGPHSKLFKSTLLVVPIYREGKVEHKLDSEGRKKYSACREQLFLD